MINLVRELTERILKKLQPNKVILVLGAKGGGKTMLIKNSQKIFNLLRLIAFQIGSEVSMQELGTQLSMSKNTVEKLYDRRKD